MKLLIVNPNTTVSMTEKIGAAAPLPKSYLGDFARYQPQTLMPPDRAKPL